MQQWQSGKEKPPFKKADHLSWPHKGQKYFFIHPVEQMGCSRSSAACSHILTFDLFVTVSLRTSTVLSSLNGQGQLVTAMPSDMLRIWRLGFLCTQCAVHSLVYFNSCHYFRCIDIIPVCLLSIFWRKRERYVVLVCWYIPHGSWTVRRTVLWTVLSRYSAKVHTKDCLH